MRRFAALILLASAAMPAQAENVIRWSSQGDAMTLDSHAQNEGMTLAMAQQIYEPLVNRTKNMILEPALAVSWGLTQDSTVWEF